MSNRTIELKSKIDLYDLVETLYTELYLTPFYNGEELISAICALDKRIDDKEFTKNLIKRLEFNL